MRLHIRFRHVDGSPELIRKIARRVHFALSRFTHSIHDVHVTIADVNGPRGGIDKTCRIQVCGPGLGDLTVAHADDRIERALDAAAGRVSRVTARAVGRRRPLASPA